MSFDIVSAMWHAETAVENFRQRYMLKAPEVLVGYPRPQLMIDLEQSDWLKRLRVAWRIATDFPSYEEDMRRCAQYYGADFRLTGQISAALGHDGVFQFTWDGAPGDDKKTLRVWSPPGDDYVSAEHLGQSVALFLRNDEQNKAIPSGVALRVHARPLRSNVPHTLADLRIAQGFVHISGTEGTPQSLMSGGQYA